MPWLPWTMKTLNDVTDQAKVLFWQPNSPAVTVAPMTVKKANPPPFQGRYDPDLDDYDPRTAPKLEIDPDENLRVHWRQILCLRSRINTSGRGDDVGHYRKVVDELVAEHQQMEDDLIIRDLKGYVDCSKETAWEDETPFVSSDFLEVCFDDSAFF